MSYHPDGKIDAHVCRVIGCFREELRPFTSDRDPRMTIAEITEEVRMFYGDHAARKLHIMVH
ncbi:hypothetical protein EAS54_19290 [Bradyrhizobium guangzhouense]|nr:hypothetical protein EAS54_19290 [Bradyrhizobium guangzhouense]